MLHLAAIYTYREREDSQQRVERDPLNGGTELIFRYLHRTLSQWRRTALERRMQTSRPCAQHKCVRIVDLAKVAATAKPKAL